MKRILKFKEFSVLLEDLTGSLDKLNKTVSTINSTDIDDKVQNNIITKLEDTSEYIEKVSHLTGIHEVFVNQKGFSEGDFETLKKILQKDSEESLVALANYLKTPKDITYFESFTDKVNLPSIIATETGISESTLLQIFGMEGQMKAGKGVGRGELFLGLMIKDAMNSGKGDVNVNKVLYEVKAKSARLTTTNNFGGGEVAVLGFLESLEGINKKLSAKYGKSEVNDFNFVFKRKKSLLFDLFEDAAKLKVLDSVVSNFIENVFLGPKSIWPRSKNTNVPELVQSAFDKNVNMRNGSIDMNGLNYGLLYANAVYYQRLEQFHAFFFVNPDNGEFAIYNPQTQDENWLMSNVAYSAPNWGDAPTSMCYKVKLESK